MSHEAPQAQLDQPTPAVEQIQQIAVQEQLFNDEAYDPQAIAERQAQAEAALGAAVEANPDKKVRLAKPLSAEAEQATRDALALLGAPDEELPDAVKVNRDYSDNLAEHNEKQAARKAAAEAVLKARLNAHRKVTASQERKAAALQEIADKEALVESRAAKTAALIESRAANDAKREADKAAAKADNAAKEQELQEAREAYIAKQRLRRGTAQADLFADEINAAADEHVNKLKSAMYPEQDPGSIVDTAKLKAERAEQIKASQVKNDETREAVKDFQRAFADIDPEAPKVQTTEVTADTKNTVVLTSEADKIAQANAEADAEDEIRIKTAQAESKEAIENGPGMTVYSYKPNAKGMADMAVSFEAPGTTIDLAELKDLKDMRVLLATEETDDYPALSFFATGDKVYNLTHLNQHKNNKGGWNVSEMAGETVITFGEPIMVDGKQVSGSVKKIMLEMPPEHIDNLDESWEVMDKRSPFKVAEKLVRSIESAAEAADTEVLDAVGPAIEEVEGHVYMQDRPKQMMGWVAKKLKQLKDAPKAAFVRGQIAINTMSERLSDMEKGKRRRTLLGAAAGALALAGGIGFAYLELSGKGTGAADQLANRRRRGGSGASLLEVVAPPSNPDKSQTLQTIADVTPKHANGATETVDHVKTVTVHGNSGDTLWHEGVKKLHREGNLHPTLLQKVDAMHRLQILNHINDAQAHELASHGDQVIKV